MLALCAGLGMFLGALDIAVNVGLPTMTKGLNTDFQTVQWVIVAFVAARAGLVMGAGNFADRFGLRRVYLFGVVVYLAAMVAISLSPSLAPVVAFRVLQAMAPGVSSPYRQPWPLRSSRPAARGWPWGLPPPARHWAW